MKKFALIIIFIAAALLAICTRTLGWFYVGLFAAICAAIRLVELKAEEE